MATELPGFRHTLVAAGTIRQYRFVKLTLAGEIVECNTDGELPIGVAQIDGGAGDAITVLSFGITKVVLGETMEPGMTVGTLNDGRAGSKQWSATGADAGDWNMGQLLRGGAADEIGEMLFGTPTFRAAP